MEPRTPSKVVPRRIALGTLVGLAFALAALVAGDPACSADGPSLAVDGGASVAWEDGGWHD
jgi:hypothetical protein